MSARTILPTALLAVGITLSLGACTSGPSVAEPSSPSASASIGSTPTASPTPTPAEAEAVAATCDTVLTEAAYAQLAADGLTLRKAASGDEQFGAVAALPGGLGCAWVKPGTDIAARYAQGAMDSGAWDAKRSDLLATGWTESGDPVEGALSSSDENGEGIPVVVAWRDGIAYYASNATVLTWGRAFTD